MVCETNFAHIPIIGEKCDFISNAIKMNQKKKNFDHYEFF